MERTQLLVGSLALLLITSAVSGAAAQDDLADYTVMNFLQDVQRLDNFEQLVFTRNRNATGLAAFGVAANIPLKSRHKELRRYQNFMLDSTLDESQFVRDLMADLGVPVILMNELSKVLLEQHFSAALMVVVYMEEPLAAQTTLLKALVASLKHRTQSKILFLINTEKAMATCDDAFLQQLFQFCWRSKMTNVVALCSDYKVTARFYSYNHFPDFSLERKSLSWDLFHHGPIYPQRLGNLQGYKLSFIMSGTDPRLVVYDYKGERIMGGYAGHFLTSFASKHNCTLYEPLPAPSITRFAPAQECVAAVRNGTVDISIGLTFPRMTSDKKFTFDGLTYPYEHANWCAWSPLEPDVPHYEFFWIVFEGLAFALTLLTIFVISIVLSFALWQYDHKPDMTRFFLHDACLRGVLAQSFRELAYAPFVIRFIYLQICILGILLTTSYNAYFAAYWTSAPKEPPFRSFNDILHSNMKVYMFAPEYNELFARAEDLRKYTPMFQIEGDYQRFLRTRDAFNTKYIYMIALSKWKIFREQQKVFTTPLFRMRHDLCLYHNIPLSFPIHSNSIFAEILNEMILETMESGLIEHWSQASFLELIRAGRLKFVDLSRKNEFRPMKVEDLKYVWIGYGVMCLVVVLVFLAEQCCYGCKRKTNPPAIMCLGENF
ncbi:PREDICTED: uncharacterized protein LOC108373270 [Rhagoletis zephyria]|uniref:uncharacterized protein LOC108373270 n=1 Tax=Rhagoletis zephyria TaxID=28612 RepID=UPI0008113F2C|nr:PREDICTED: uncharacterized protein LOC108373270 [Rhagoletis zephyria]